MPPDQQDEAERPGVNPVLTGAFIILLLLGAGMGWLALSGGKETASTPKVTLSLDPNRGLAEDLMVEPAKPITDTPSALPPIRRVLAVSIGADGRMQLSPAPDAALVEQGENGPLPKIAADGAQAWHVYSRPFPVEDARPRIAIIIGGTGLNKTTVDAALQRLPAAVTLSITPYAGELQDLTAKVRAMGHEMLLEIPMEPFDYPENDPGPHALLTTSSPKENTVRLEWLLGRFTGYVGAINFLGGKFVTSEAALGPVMAELKGRGLMMVDDQTGQRSQVASIARRIEMPFATANMLIDGVQDAQQIDAKLAALEEVARANGHAAGIGFSYPLTIERLANWSAQLEARGIVLAPISALIETPGGQAPAEQAQPPLVKPPEIRLEGQQ